MTDRTVPNLPSRDFARTIDFYGGFGFVVTYRSDAWLILRRGDLDLEFFPYADLDPLSSSFMCSVRVDDLHGLYGQIAGSGVAEGDQGHPRLHPARTEPWGGRVASLIDLDGTQLNLIQND